jgi:CheY-like chemotaxis protein
MNLCINALDAMPKGGTLTFRTAPFEEDWIEVFVEDTGEGMTAEILAHALDPYFTTKEVGKGTGLGLSMSHDVVKAHGGTFEISSQPGVGTVVKLRFPRIPTPVARASHTETLPTLKILNLLMVDDDKYLCEMTEWMLERAGGFLFKSVSSGEEALEYLGSVPLPDLVILDQNMPGMDGVRTMERIRILYPDLPILISSGRPDIGEWSCFKQPKVSVLAKPFNVAELRTKLAELLPGAEPSNSET